MHYRHPSFLDPDASLPGKNDSSAGFFISLLKTWSSGPVVDPVTRGSEINGFALDFRDEKYKFQAPNSNIQ